jgi:hypothetical protein
LADRDERVIGPGDEPFADRSFPDLLRHGCLMNAANLQRSAHGKQAHRVEVVSPDGEVAHAGGRARDLSVSDGRRRAHQATLE